MATWQLQEAKAKLSEVIETATKHGPQIITQRGVETAVIIPIAEWKAAQPKKTLLDILQSGPQGDLNVPARGSWKMRKPVKF